MGSIVVGVDRSETAGRAAQAASELAAATGYPLHAVMAISKQTTKAVKVGTDTWHIDSLAQAEEYVADIARRLGGPNATWSVQTDDAADALCAEAARVGASYIVVGNRRTQGASRILGSVAAAVTRHAPCHVVVANTAHDGEPSTDDAAAATSS